MYSISFKRYIDLKQRRRVDLRVYWYNNLKTIFGCVHHNSSYDKFFIKFSKLLNLLFYGFKLAKLRLSLNMKQTAILFLFGSVLKTELGVFKKYLLKHKLGLRLKNRLLRNLNRSFFVDMLKSKFSIGFKLRHKSFLYSKRWQ